MRSSSFNLASLLSRLKSLRRARNRTPALVPEGYGFSSSCSSAYSNLKSVLPCAKTNGLICNFRRLQGSPYSEQINEIQSNPQASSRRRKLDKAALDEAFENAETIQDMLRLFGQMEECFEEKELGMASLKVGLKLDQEGEDPERALLFGIRAFRALDDEDDDNGNPSLPVAMALQLCSSASLSLNRFRDALAYANKSKRVLTRLELEKDANGDDIKAVLHAVYHVLATSKMAMGRKEEALDDFKKCLEIKETILGSDSTEFGVANREMAEAYVSVLNFKEALQYGLKALEIHTTELGNNSVQVAHDRKTLGIIYSGLENYEQALEQNESSQKILKKWGLNKDWIQAEIDASNIKIALGKYDEAIIKLKEVVHLTEKDSKTRATAFISLARTLCNQGKTSEAKNCLEIAGGILSKKETTCPIEVAEAYSEMGSQYESMNDYETALSLLKKSLRLLEKAHIEQESEARISARVGWLLLLSGKVADAIPYLENSADRLKESFGPNHYGLGYIYNNIGAAYMELDRPESAAQALTLSKEIMVISLGPHHVDTIEAFQNLAKAHSAMKNYAIAIEFQNEAVSGWERLGPDASAKLNEARLVLEDMNTKASAAQVQELVDQTLADMGIDGNKKTN